MDTDSLYIKQHDINKLSKYNFIGNELYQGKNDINVAHYINKS